MIGKTDICRDRNKTIIVINAISQHKSKFFKSKNLTRYIPNYSIKKVSSMIPYLKELNLIKNWTESTARHRHDFTYERLFQPKDIETIINGLGG